MAWLLSLIKDLQKAMILSPKMICIIILTYFIHFESTFCCIAEQYRYFFFLKVAKMANIEAHITITLLHFYN